MAEGGNWTLTEGDIVGLAQGIAARNMESIALKYFGIDWETRQSQERTQGRHSRFQPGSHQKLDLQKLKS